MDGSWKGGSDGPPGLGPTGEWGGELARARTHAHRHTRRAGCPRGVGRKACPADYPGRVGRARLRPAARPGRARGPGRVGRRARPPRAAPAPEPSAPASPWGLRAVPASPPGSAGRPVHWLRAGAPAAHTQVPVPALRGATSALLRSHSPRAAMWVGNPQPGSPPTTEDTPGEQPEGGWPRPAGGGCSPSPRTAAPLRRAEPHRSGAGGPRQDRKPPGALPVEGMTGPVGGAPAGAGPRRPPGVTSGRGAVSAGGMAGGMGSEGVPRGPRPPAALSL